MPRDKDKSNTFFTIYHQSGLIAKEKVIFVPSDWPFGVEITTSVDKFVHFFTQQLQFERWGFEYMEFISLFWNGIARQHIGGFTYSTVLHREIKIKEKFEQMAIHLDDKGWAMVNALHASDLNPERKEAGK